MVAEGDANQGGGSEHNQRLGVKPGQRPEVQRKRNRPHEPGVDPGPEDLPGVGFHLDDPQPLAQFKQEHGG